MRRCDKCGCLDIDPSDNEEQYRPCDIRNGDTCISCRELSCMNLQISNVKDQLEKLLYKRRKLKTERNHEHDLMNSLPMELISYIFEFYVADMSTDNQWGSPMILSAVCQAWRKLIESTPVLWTYIQIFLSKSTVKINVDILTNHIHHSGRLPLSIKIRAEETKDDIYSRMDIESRFTPFVEELCSCSDRWEVFDCEVVNGITWRRLRQHIDGALGAPILKTLRLWSPISQPYLMHAESTPSSALSKPCPTSVSFRHMIPQYFDIDWSCVKRVTATNISGAAIFNVFALAEQATNCTFHVIDDISSNDTLNAKTTHSMITHLTVAFESSSSHTPMIRLFMFATLPSLQKLSVNLFFKLLPVDVLARFLKKSACPLRSLTLDNVGTKGYDDSYNSNDLINLFKAAPLLQDLAINCYPKDSLTLPCNDLLFNLLKTRTASNDGEVLLPALKSLQIKAKDIKWDIVEQLCLLNHEATGPLLPRVRIVDYCTGLPTLELEKRRMLAHRRRQGMVTDLYVAPLHRTGKSDRLDLVTGLWFKSSSTRWILNQLTG